MAKKSAATGTNSNTGKLAKLDMAKADENLYVKIAKTVDVGDSNNETKLADDPIYSKSRQPQEQLGLLKRTPGANNYRKRSAKLVYTDEQMEEFLAQLSASEEENAKIVKDGETDVQKQCQEEVKKDEPEIKEGEITDANAR